MAKNLSGRDYGLYLKATAPTSQYIVGGYTLVGYLTNVSISQSRGAIETSSQTSGDDSAFIAGRRNVTISGTAHWDHTSDTGQAILATTLAASAGSCYVAVGTGTVGDIGWFCQGILTSYNVTAADESVSQVDFTIQASTAVTEFSVNT